MRSRRIILFLLVGVFFLHGCSSEESGEHMEMNNEQTVQAAEPNIEADLVNLIHVPANNEITLPGIIGPNMVLQRDRPLQIWGQCAHDGPVAVMVNEQAYYGECSDGRFDVQIDPLEAGGPYAIAVGNRYGKAVLDNVLVGDVFLASGQSNMVMNMAQANQLGEAGNPENARLRFYQSTPIASSSPLDATGDVWMNTDSVVLPNLSAVAYYFGRTLQEQLDIPIGIVVAAVGGTILSTWAPAEEAAQMPDAYADASLLNYTPSVYYNAMIHPLKKMKFKGVLWYQGENQPLQYDELLTLLIQGWRRSLQDEHLHFTIVQLPRWGEGDPETWYTSREHQKNVALQMEHATYSVNIDLGEREDDIHPADKKPVGIRAAYATMASLYGEEGIWRGPALSSYTLEGNKFILSFENRGSGLWLANDGVGFEIAGDEGQYERAHAEIQGETVVIWHEAIDHPVAARYAYGAFPDVSLYNKEGFPAEQFKITK